MRKWRGLILEKLGRRPLQMKKFFGNLAGLIRAKILDGSKIIKIGCF
jgi:hypothetical protein